MTFPRWIVLTALLLSPTLARGEAFHVHSLFVKTDRATCSARLAHTLEKTEKFLKVETDADGQVHGVGESASLVGFFFPQREGEGMIVVLAAVHADIHEAGKLVLRVKDALEKEGDGSELKLAKAEEPEKSDRKSTAWPLRWSIENRPSNKTTRLLVPASQIVMEKQGLNTNSVGNSPMAFGGDQNRVAAMLAVPDANDDKINILVLSASPRIEEAERLHRALKQELVKVLFE